MEFSETCPIFCRNIYLVDMTGPGKKKQKLQALEEGRTSRASSLLTMMSRMAKDTSTTDFTLICGELRRPVHSCVLANKSPYFEAVVKRWTQGEKEINVESCDAEVLTMVIDFMYGISLNEKKVGAYPQMQEGLLELSRRLLMNDLKVEVEKVILLLSQLLNADPFKG